MAPIQMISRPHFLMRDCWEGEIHQKTAKWGRIEAPHGWLVRMCQETELL